MENEYETMGFVPIERELFHTPFWLLERVYSEFEALLDLKREARYSEKPKFHKLNGNFVEVKRGQLMASVRFLCSRWGWSNTKVTSFLSNLEKMGFAKIDKRQGVTVITILSVEAYGECIYKQTTGGDRARQANDESRQGNDGQRQAATKQKESKEEGKERTPPTPSKGDCGRVSFVPPTQEEWLAYAATKRPLGEEDRAALVSLYHYYAGNGWVRGKTRIRNWEACVDGKLAELEPLTSAGDAKPIPEPEDRDRWRSIHYEVYGSVFGKRWTELRPERQREIAQRYKERPPPTIDREAPRPKAIDAITNFGKS